jgi:nucleotide sugar dehydrogenase
MSGEFRLAIVGLGKLGLPLAAFYAARGASVIGCDRDAERLARIRARDLATEHEEGLLAALDRAGERLEVTGDTAGAVARSSHVIVVVPVVARAQGDVDFFAMDAAVRAIAAGLRPGTLVILETTVPVGTTRKRLVPGLESSGLRAGGDFFVAYSPERVFIGHVHRDLDTYPKIVGGIDDESTRRAADLYGRFIAAPVWTVRDAETAEFSKLAETSYRITNIALANELAMAADQLGVDVTEAIRSANSQPYSKILSPGIGVGGLCLPVYPFLLDASGASVPLVMLGRAINADMGRYAVARLERAIGPLRGCGVLLLGVAFRPGVHESAFSPAFVVRDALRASGATVYAHDPLYSADEIRRLGFEPTSLESPPHVDALVLVTEHPEYRDLDLARFEGCRVVLDGRNALDPERAAAPGRRYLGIGR